VHREHDAVFERVFPDIWQRREEERRQREEERRQRRQQRIAHQPRIVEVIEEQEDHPPMP
jgi:hypothetical protein